MSLKVGIVGLANVGKSTLFNALLKRAQAMVANYPFATIEPNVGIVPVPDERLDALAEVIAKSRVFSAEGAGRKEIPMRVELPPKVQASVEFVDIAGLVAGASKGEGLGNKFLANIREVDLIAHVVRDFSDGNIVRTGADPKSDYYTVTAELIFKDMESLEKQKIGISKDRSKEGAAKMAVIAKLEEGFNSGKRAYEILNAEEAEMLRDLFLLTMKPEIVVVNVAESELGQEIMSKKQEIISQMLGIRAENIVIVSAKIESEIATLSDDDAALFMADLGVSESGLSRLIKTAYTRLGLISFLTAGEIEVRAWTIKAGSNAVEASGAIHTDFMNKFIKAEVVSFADFVEFGGWKKCRELGKVRLEGRDYIMQDGDIVDFKIGG